MKKLEFKIDINASKEKVWNTMLNHGTYEEWVAAGWPGASYEGNWEKGEDIRFIGDGQGGTMANIQELTPNEYILAKHVAVINKDGSLDRDSEMAKGWVGSTEAYTFTERNGKTHLVIDINTQPDWESMFNDGWPNALQKLKEVSER